MPDSAAIWSAVTAAVPWVANRRAAVLAMSRRVSALRRSARGGRRLGGLGVVVGCFGRGSGGGGVGGQAGGLPAGLGPGGFGFWGFGRGGAGGWGGGGWGWALRSSGLGTLAAHPS